MASYDFQAPGMYEKAGFKRVAAFKEWPEGYINVVLCKTLSDQENRSPDVRSAAVEAGISLGEPHARIAL